MWTLIKIDIACKIMDVVCVCMQRISMVVCETDFPLNIVSLYDNIGNAWRIKRIGEVHSFYRENKVTFIDFEPTKV